MKQIFIFRGSPASGKGTITLEFLKKIPGKVALIELDKFRWGFHLFNRSAPDITPEEHQLAYKNYLNVLENYLSDGSYTIVTEGLFSWNIPSPHGNMQDILPLCEKYDFQINPVLLTADYEVLWNRNMEREYSVPEGEFKDLYSHVMNEKSDSELFIDVEKNTVEQSVEVLTDLLK
jgi:predicted kinase